MPALLLLRLTWPEIMLYAGLAAPVLVGLPLGGLFFLRRSGTAWANHFYGFFLLAAAGTLLHHLLRLAGLYQQYPTWETWPIYLSLAIPVCLFFHVKLCLYPAYRLRFTDLKHFVLPVGQWIFFIVLCLRPTAVREAFDRYFYNPFYGGMEQGFYLISFVAYLYFSYAYLRRRRMEQRRRVLARKIWYLRRLLRTTLLLFIIHAGFIISDFVSFEIFGINLHQNAFFAACGALSYAFLVYWWCLYGTQVLIWGRKRLED
jgi:hypothetical protein